VIGWLVKLVRKCLDSVIKFKKSALFYIKSALFW